ncbi:MAG: hypothetical protein ACTSU3_10190 [Candidatus Thorarchaeota archaeon]
MKLREDPPQYCFLWMGIIFLSAYYFNFIYSGFSLTASFLFTIGAPIILVFFFMGYLKPVRGKSKSMMLSIAVVLSALFAIVVFQNNVLDWQAGLFTAAWGIGSAILTAGGFSMSPTLEASSTPGMLDVSKLHYGPVKEIVEEVEETPVVEVTDSPIESTDTSTEDAIVEAPSEESSEEDPTETESQ